MVAPQIQGHFVDYTKHGEPPRELMEAFGLEAPQVCFRNGNTVLNLPRASSRRTCCLLGVVSKGCRKQLDG